MTLLFLFLLLQRSVEEKSSQDHLATGTDKNEGHAGHAYSATPPGTVKEEIFEGEKFRTFPFKTFRMEFNFVL